MTVFSARPAPTSHPQHSRVLIYAGSDDDHLQFAGVVTLRKEEIEDFLALFTQAAASLGPVHIYGEETL